MQLDAYVRGVQDQLVASAALGDDRVRDVAGILAGAASPAIRLAILSALSAAADDINAALLDTPGVPVVAVQLDSDEIRIAVTHTSVEPPRPDEADASARISLRLSEGLKAEIDGAAGRAGVSVNTWLVRSATTALGSTTDGSPGARTARDRARNAHHVTGWIN